jgi:2-polyprenyl-3-methyl-5-hydroxy-6-metoxy-1,4-benzoquinol methylase
LNRKSYTNLKQYLNRPSLYRNAMDQKEVYRELARAYHILTPLTPCHQELVQDAKAALRGKHTILDAGVGTGLVAKQLAGGGHLVYGVDTSEEMLEMAISHCIEEMRQGRISLSKQDISSLAFKNGFFDGAVCLNVLYHVQDYASALAEVGRTLRSGGTIVLSGPNKKANFDALWQQVEEAYRANGALEKYPTEVMTIRECNRHLADGMKTKLDAGDLVDILRERGFTIKLANNWSYYGHGHFVVGVKR